MFEMMYLRRGKRVKISDAGSVSVPVRSTRFGAAWQSGFSLIELVMVIVVMGVLAAVAVPKIVGVSAFNGRGFHDQTLAYLRFAQKTAVAQRRTVCVSFSSTSVTLSMASVAGTFDCASPATLVGPQGESPVVLNAKSGISIGIAGSGSVPAAFNFNSLGEPISSTGTAQAVQVLQVSGAANTITIESSTGYVHD
jgi:MSHA pilin protein MshC